MTETEDVEADARVLARGLLGRKVAWLSSTGMVHSTVLISDVIEMVRCRLDIALSLGLGSTAGEIAEALAAERGMTVAKVCVWPTLAMAGHDGHLISYPAAIGVLLAEPAAP